MSIAIYLDENFYGPWVSALREHGVDLLTAFEDSMNARPDTEVLNRALYLRRVLVTSDKGFLAMAAALQRSNIEFPGIIFLKHADASGVHFEDLETIALAGIPEDILNQVWHLPLH